MPKRKKLRRIIIEESSSEESERKYSRRSLGEFARNHFIFQLGSVQRTGLFQEAARKFMVGSSSEKKQVKVCLSRTLS